MKKILNLFKKTKSSAGFTLIELIVAMAITTIVVGLTGWGVVAITQKSKEQKIETDRRVELNRALDFIADEVRQAKPIATDADAPASLSTATAQGFTSANKTPILTLQIPGETPGVIYPVVYYIAAKPASSPLLGTNIIYRWGPRFADNGKYSTPVTWTDEPLVDLINDPNQPNTPTCPNSWTINTSSSIKGFYACVDRSGKVAEIHLGGELVDAYGNPSQSAFEVSTKVFARPNTPSFTTGGNSSDDSGAGTITITQPSTAYFEIIGGDVSGVTPTTATINQTINGNTTNTPVNSSTKTLNVSAATGTTLTVTGRANSVSIGGRSFGGFNANSETDKTTQVYTLRNGYEPPPFTAYTGQSGIDAIVAKYIDANGKIKLGENQVIYLFEVITTNTNHAYYDMQDIVVLATIVPNN